MSTRASVRSVLLVLSVMCSVRTADQALAQGVPDPPNATVPALIHVVGNDGVGTIDPGGRFTVVLRDFANNPIPNAIIRVELLPCSGVSLCPVQDVSVTAMNCNGATLDLGGCDGAGANDLAIWLDDFVDGTNPQRSDYDGNQLVGANDFSLWLSAYGRGQSAINCGGASCP